MIVVGRVSFLEGRPGALAVHAALLEAAGRQQEADAAVQVGTPCCLGFPPNMLALSITCMFVEGGGLRRGCAVVWHHDQRCDSLTTLRIKQNGDVNTCRTDTRRMWLFPQGDCQLSRLAWLFSASQVSTARGVLAAA